MCIEKGGREGSRGSNGDNGKGKVNVAKIKHLPQTKGPTGIRQTEEVCGATHRWVGSDQVVAGLRLLAFAAS